MVQVIYAPKQKPAPEQLVLETEQPGSQVDEKPPYISKDIGEGLEVYWTIVRLSVFSAIGLSKRTFSFPNPTGEKSFITTEAFLKNIEENEVFRSGQVSYETMNALKFSVEDKLEEQRDLLTQKFLKLIPMSRDPRARIPSIPFLVNATTHL